MGKWSIYALKDSAGVLFYVGFSINHKRRLKEHRTVHGCDISLSILEIGEGPWQERERFWISEMRRLGHPLTNIALGGYGKHSVRDSTRAKMSEMRKGKKKPPEMGAKISAKTKGVPHDWSDDGWERAAASHFKSGIAKDPEVEGKRRAAQQAFMNGRTHEQKSERSRIANEKWWAEATEEQRAERKSRMMGARDPARMSAAAKRNSARYITENPEMRARFGARIREFWANLTPEARTEYLLRRGEKIREAKAAKKAARLTFPPQS